MGIFIAKMGNALKYTIKNLAGKLPRAVNPANDLAELGITKSTFYRDQSISSKSAQNITGDRLQIYAHYFNVSMEQLFAAPLKVKAKAKLKTPLR